MVKTGENAPSFKLPSTTGGERALEDFRGKKLVVFFYPKDETPGCTREACGFRDNYDAIRAAGAEVIGISKDSIGSHDRFRSNHGLPFELLSDADNAVATEFGAFGEKKMYGRTVLGTIRSTFLLDENGVVEHVWSPVRVDGHVEQVVERLGGTPVAAPAAPKPPAKKTAKKAPSKKAAKKKTTKKKAAKKKVTKKTATKKKTTKKKTTKKKTTKKKTTKKKATKKKATKKKATTKKATKKKGTQKKRATAKKASKKRR